MASFNLFVSPAATSLVPKTQKNSILSERGVTPAALTQQSRLVSTAATATKGSSGGSAGGKSVEKGPFDWIISGLVKQEQLLWETDPILKKVDDKPSGIGTTSRGKGTVTAAPPAKKKNGGFGLGSLFAKE